MAAAIMQAGTVEAVAGTITPGGVEALAAAEGTIATAAATGISVLLR